MHPAVLQALDVNSVQQKHNVSVRQLAMDLFRCGDLYRTTPGRVVDAEEGIKVQKKVQKQRAAEFEQYTSERKATWQGEMMNPSGASVTLEITGRMDGFADETSHVLVEEFKTCGAHPQEADPVDWGQLFLYAALYASETVCSNEGVKTKRVIAKLIYVEADTLAEKVFEQTFETPALLKALTWLLALYSVRWQRHERFLDKRDSWAQNLEFPMPEFRRGQQALARRVFQAVKAREDLLLEAPTGSGKSLAVLYPSLKAIGHSDQLFFLTGRNAGREAALNAVDKLDAEAEHLSVVDITAKEKICFVPGMPCDPTICKYAAGYYDKLGHALDQCRAAKRCDRDQLEQIAEDNEVCPFELSLDIALEADLIIGDYNYIFDPIVRLQRFSQAKDLHLLCDEVHQLVPRMREGLSTSLTRAEIRQALNSSVGELKPRIKSLDRALMKYRKGLGEGDHVLEEMDAIDRAAKRLVEYVAELELDLQGATEVQALFFNCLRWVRSADWRGDGVFYCEMQVKNKGIRTSYVCLDPGPYIEKVGREFASNIRFSATLTPLSLTARLQGNPEIDAERAQNPFTTEQLAVFSVSDISTFYRDRAASLPRLSELILDINAARPGKYMIALPSYEYLSQLQVSLEGRIQQHVQEAGATPEVLANLVEELGARGGVLLAVMGGSLSESIDFLGARLDGVIVVGLGLPPPSLVRDQQAQHFDAAIEPGMGQLVAYTQPAMTKILQSAGRLIRDVQDRGIICLVDPRFRKPNVRQFFPEHWRVQEVASDKVSTHVRKFWST